MYQNAAILAAFLLIYSAFAGRVERSWISGPIVFTGIGFVLGPDGLGVIRINIGGEGLRILAEMTLAMVLFTDAANADFGVVRRNLGLPERLLLIGLPLTIVLGFVAAAIVFPSLATLELALLAAMLAPTDAALGKPVVTNQTQGRPAAWRREHRRGAGAADMGDVRGHRGRPHDRPCHLAGVALCSAQPDCDPDASGLSVPDRYADEYGGQALHRLLRPSVSSAMG